MKYAGSKPMDFLGKPEEAIERLVEAISIYKRLEHPSLIKLVDHFRLESGYALVFEWFEGECLHSHWSFGGQAKYTNPASPFYRFKNLDIHKRLDAFDSILSFHSYVESKGIVAVDFYDGSILYDFKNDETKICDIDYYRKSPSINNVGEHFWGSTRFKAPEEFTLGGAVDHSFSKWEANPKLYEIAIRAVENNRDQRYPTIQELYEEWKVALK